MTDTVVAEGQVKFRDGKKWKTRWVVLRKPSPVADCLSLLVYKEKKKKGKDKGSGHKERLNVTLEGICGVEPGLGYEGVPYSLSILCLAHTLVLGFSSRDALLAWDARVRYSLGEVHRFSVGVEPGAKLEGGPASLHLCNSLLVLTRGIPPITIGQWKLSALRRYGAVPNGFVFEGGTRCGYWAGVFYLSCSEGERINFLLDCIARGVSPSRAPHGLRPALPDLGATPASVEERICQEASDLEKRLSMLSQSSLASSTASAYTCSTSVAGDDRSSISSTSSSQSDLSARAEPPARLHLSNETASSSSTVRALTGPGARPPSGQPRPRGLNDSGRQSSLDSGIGIAAGSQSSYSGSCSSCTGSLDASSQGGSEEFGSAGSLPASPPPPAPPPSPPPGGAPSRSSSSSSLRRGEERQTPSLLRLLGYDSPRSALHTPSPREPPKNRGPPEHHGDGGSGLGRGESWGRRLTYRSQRSGSRGSDRAPSADSEGRCTPRPPLQLGETEENYVTPEQWQSARDKCLSRVAFPPSGPAPPSRPTQDAPLCVTEEHDGVEGLCDKLVLMKSSLPPSSPPPPPASSPSPTPTGGFFQSPMLEAGLRGDRIAHYVNIPFSHWPENTSREWLYADVQEPSAAAGPGPGYTHTDERTLTHLAAMVTNQSLGVERVEGGPSRPESRGRGLPR